MKKERIFSLAIVLACLLGFSCKVGLGEAVDTVPPTVTITYPPAGSVVRDTFVLAGDCDDDTNVTSVDVYYERTGTYAMDKRLLGTVNVTAGDRSWALEINPSSVDIKDGSYVFYAVAKDTQGRTSGTYTQSLEIDNTPPVLILTKPTSYGDISPKEYGRSVSIEGTYAEATENRIDKLVVTFYDGNGNRINLPTEKTTFNDITDMSNANPLIIAKYDTSTGDELVEQRHYIYTQLYGDNLEAGAKQFYFTVTAYDKAKIFNDPSSNEGTGDGNASVGFYKGTNDVLNLINGNKDGYSSFSVKKIQELKNGLDDTYAEDDDIEDWLANAWVESAAPTVSTPRSALSTDDLTPEKKANALNFSMNPANYPTFTVSGLDIKTGSEANDDNHVGGYFKYYSGTPLNFSIMSGLDQTKIAVDSISIYVAKVTGSSVDLANKILVWTWNPEKGPSNSSRYTVTPEGANADSVAKTIPINFQTDSYYSAVNNDGTKWKFVVEGKDINEGPVQDYLNTGYGFIATINPQAAQLEIGDENEAENKNRRTNAVTPLSAYDNYKFDGSIITNGETTVTYEMVVTDASDLNRSWPSSGSVTLTNNNSRWNATLSPNPTAKDEMTNPRGLYNVIVTFSAENAAGTTKVTRTFSIDTEAPEVSVKDFTNSVKKDGEDVYYIKSNGSFELSGNTMDNYRIQNTHLTVSGNGTTREYDNQNSTWYFTPDFSGFTAQSGNDNDVTVVISATDMAGNTGTKTLKVEFDNVGPTGKHELDGKNKDLYFRIGEGDTGTGFKYSSGSWGNSTTMKIRGLFEDEGSGVKMIYYQVCHPGDTSTAMTAANYETTSNGYFAPFAKKGEEREEAVVKNNDEQGTSTTTVNIKTNYEAILTGFVEGSNTLRLVAVDNVGNAKLDQEYSLNVDLTPPTIESSNSEIPTNGTSNIVFSGTASDEGSGFESATKSLEFYIGKTKYKVTSDGADNTPKGSYTFTQVSGNDWEWTLTIDNSNGWLMRQDIQDELTNHPGIYANIKDKAGLSTSAIKVASLTIDTTPPEVVIGDIKDAYTSTNDTEVNGNITISGRASDNKEFPTPAVTPKLYYRTTNPGNATITSTTGWTEIAEANYDEKEGLNTWSYTLVDTTKAFGTNYSGNVWLMASAVDKAGNTGYSAAKKIIVDQNTDRPIISFTDLSNDTTWLQRSDLRGSISDDDGIEEFRVFVGNTCPNDWQLNSSNVTSGYPPVATSSGSWSFDAGEDGTKRLWFYVKDTEGTVFISSRGNAINKPYYQYSTDTGVSQGVYGHSATTFVEVKKDTTQPKLWTTLVAIGENSDPYNATTNPGGLKDIDLLKQDRGANQLNSSKIVGGKQNHFVIYVPVYEEFVDAVTAQILDEENRVETNSYTINGGPKPTVVLEKVTVDGTPGGTPVTIERDDDSLIYTYYRGEVIDVSSLPKAKSGIKSVQITIKDQAGNEKVQTCTLTVDNKGPTVNLISPKSTDEVTGIVDVSGTSIDGNASVDETYWMIPTSTQRGWDDDVLASSVNDPLWSNIRADDTTATSWKFRFDGEAGSNPLLTRFDKANTDGNTYYTDYTNYVYTLPLYIKSVDSVGNYTIQKFTIKHNPDADRPRTTITYPTSANYGAGLDYAVLGGTILVTGNVQIPSGTTNPDAVYLQIATDTDSFDSYSTVNTNGSDPYVAKNKYMLPVMNADQALAARRAAGSTYSVLEGFDSEEDKAAWWGIEAEGSGSSWYINLNSDEKMNPAGETTTNIWIRACGINANGKIGVWSDPVAIHIDANAPIQNASIRQYEDVSPSANNLKAATPTANNAYVADMFIKGQWYLTVEMTDESSLEKVDVKDKNGELMSSSSYYLTAAYDEGGKKKRILWIPMDTSGNTASYTVAVTDTEGSGKHITTNKYSFNIDNEAPAFIEGSLKGNGDLLANGSVIAEKDYVYTISGDVEEAGSGFERVFFYFVRKGTGMSQEVLINPMVTSNPKVTLSGLQTFTVEQDGESFSMYGVNVAGTVQGHTFTPTNASAITGNQNIQVGGLIRIGGIYKKITAKANNGTITLDSDTGITTATSTTAGFPYGQVIDNQSTEKIADNGKRENPFVLTADDGDKMPETVSKLGSLYSWDGTIHSSNMPDGPVKLVILAFDKAGNVSCREFNTSVQNNAPRVAKLYLGTDLNGDSKYGETEFNTYSIIGATGDSASNYELDTSSSDFGYNKAFVIKDKLAVVPEIVGGNGNIALYYKLGAANTNAITSTAGTSASAIAAANVFSFAPADGNKVLAYQIPKANLGDDGTGKKLGLTFWDSTEELQQGSTSQNCTLLVTNLEVDQVDNTPPTSKIDTFYWNSLNDNSIYGSENANEVSELKGHIELEGELSDDVKTAYGADDPKVSGKIRILGKSYDETKLYSISFALTSLKLNGGTKGASVVLATYNPQSNAATEEAKWTVINGATSGTAGGNIDSDGWQFKILTDSGLTQEGHTVTWELDIDTAKIEGVVAENEKLTTIAQDKPGETTHNPSVPGTTQTTKDTPTGYYKMDVVPYVYKVYTGLAKNKKMNWSVYNRTALGHYPVQSVVSNAGSGINMKTTASENVTLYGFNINHSSATITSGTKTFTVNGTGTLKIDNSTAGQLVFNVAQLSSGELNLTVNGKKIVNNINNNDAKGAATAPGRAYANWYNRQGNGDTNNNQTDDIVFDVWEFNDRAAVPINGLSTGINMEVNQKTGMLNYAFANGGLYYSMGGNINKTTAFDASNSYSSYYWAGDWDTFAGPCVGFHVDDLGYTYSVVSGGDTNSSGSVDKWDLYTSRWGYGLHSTAGTLNEGGSGDFHALRLEEIGLKTGANDLDYSLMKYRFLSPEFASTVNTTNSTTNLYLVYYDALCNQIRFRAGTFSGTTRQSTGGFQDQYTSGASSYYNTNNCQVIANGKDGATFKSSANANTAVAGISGRGAGQYVDVAVVKNAAGKDVVCVVWFDSEDNNCKFSYIVDPIASWASLKGNATAASWSTPVPVFEEGGEYCHIVADKNNHLHIAAYAGNSDVKYAYLDTYTSDPVTCTVDSSGSVGEHLTLDVAVSSNGNSIPYIGYYTSAIKMPKYAYLVDKTTDFDQTADGVDDDELFTGAWEVTVVPSPSRMTTNREDKVNIGVWKNAGVLKNSTAGTSTRGGSLNGYSSTNWSQTFGNGTANGVLGYQISTATGSCLETAQLR